MGKWTPDPSDFTGDAWTFVAPYRTVWADVTPERVHAQQGLHNGGGRS